MSRFDVWARRLGDFFCVDGTANTRWQPGRQSHSFAFEPVRNSALGDKAMHSPTARILRDLMLGRQRAYAYQQPPASVGGR